MNIEEMHIKLDMELQKVSTYTQRNLQPKEIDFFFNEEVFKFIDIRNGSRADVKQLKADASTKRYEDLDDLTRYKVLDVKDNGDGTGVCILPDNYLHYISSKTNIYQLCTGDNLTKTPKTLYKCVFPVISSLEDNEIGTTINTYCVTINKDGGNIEAFNLDNDLPKDYVQYKDFNKQRFMLVKGMKIILPEKLGSNYSVYWQSYGEEFYNNSFIIVSDTSFNSITVNELGVETTYNSETVEYEINTENSSLWGRNRLIDDESEFDAQQSYLSGSRPESPFIQLRQGILQVAIPKGTICQKINLKYISKPTILDKELGKNLNMKRKVCQEIVSNTVRFIKGVFQGDYQTYLNENVMIE